MSTTSNYLPAMQVNPQVDSLVDYCYGRESQTDDVGAVARFIKAFVTVRPATGSGQPSRWQSIDALKTHTRHHGPSCTPAQVDAALAAAGLD